MHLFDRAVCLNLDRRFEERKRLQKEFSGFAREFSFFLAGDGKSPLKYDHVDEVPALKDCSNSLRERPGSFNAFLCFRKIVAQAQADGVQTLLLLEDDASLIRGGEKVIGDSWKTLQQVNPRFDMLYLGANHTWGRTSEIKPNLLKVRGAVCFHAVVLARSVFHDILALPMDGAIDLMAAQHIHTNTRRNCYACWPNAIIQAPGHSYVEGKFRDYSQFWSEKGLSWPTVAF